MHIRRLAFWLTVSVGTVPLLMAQEYVLESVSRIGGGNWDVVLAAAADTSRNIYIGGHFRGEMILGASGLMSSGGNDLFIARMDESGLITEARRLSGSPWNTIHAILVNPLNQVTVTGTFRDSLRFGPIVLYGKRETSCYQALLTPDLEPVWIRTPLSGPRFRLLSASADTAGNIYISGYFKNWLATADTIVRTSGNEDLFVARTDPSGNIDWIVSGSGKGNTHCNAIAITSDNDLVIAGHFNRELIIGDTTLLSKGREDMFIAKLGSGGNPVWIKSIGGASDDRATALAAGPEGEIYLAGSFRNSIFPDTLFVSRGQEDILLIRLDRKGEIIWSEQIGGSLSDQPDAITCNRDEDLFLAGTFRGTVYTGEDTLVASDRQSDILFAGYSRNGEKGWTKHFTGTSEDLGRFAFTDHSGKVYIAGTFADRLDIDNKSLISNGLKDIFVAKFLDPCMLYQFNLPDERVLCEHSTVTLDAGEGFASYSWNDGTGTQRFYEVSEGGNYPVSVVDTFGCVKQDTIRVLTDSIRIEYTVTDEVLPEGNNGSIQVTAHGMSDRYYYYWDRGDTTAILSNLSQGTYLLTIRDGFDCEAYAEIVVGQTVESGILSLSSSPNPFHDITRIIYSIPGDSHVDISLFDMNGRKLFTIVNMDKETGVHQLEWNRNNLSSGTYYLQIRTPDGLISCKVVITDR